MEVETTTSRFELQGKIYLTPITRYSAIIDGVLHVIDERPGGDRICRIGARGFEIDPTEHHKALMRKIDGLQN